MDVLKFLLLDSEISSFIFKFKSPCRAGKDAEAEQEAARIDSTDNFEKKVN